MCEYCKAYFDDKIYNNIGDIFITSPALFTFVGDGDRYPVPMRFCPNCGEKIEMEDEEFYG